LNRWQLTDTPPGIFVMHLVVTGNPLSSTSHPHNRLLYAALCRPGPCCTLRREYPGRGPGAGPAFRFTLKRACMKPSRHTRLKGILGLPDSSTRTTSIGCMKAVFRDQRKNLSSGAPLLPSVIRNAGTNLLRILRAGGFAGAAGHARGYAVLQRRVPDGSRKAGSRRRGTPAARETPGRRSVTLEQVTLREGRLPSKCGGHVTPAGSVWEGHLFLIELKSTQFPAR